MEGKLIKDKEHYYLTVDNKIFADIDGHPLKAITNKLSLKNCETVVNGYDLDELACVWHKNEYGFIPQLQVIKAYVAGFKKALEILGDKKFSEGDVMLGWDAGVMSKSIIDNNWLGPIKQEKLKEHRDSYKENLKPVSLQQTEWVVEIETEVIPDLDTRPEIDGQIFSTNKKIVPKLDVNGCLILRRK